MKSKSAALGLAIAVGIAAAALLGTISSAPRASAGGEARFVSLDPRFDAIVPRGARVEKLADGFTWVEGPAWDRSGGYLLFSDIPNNVVMKWKQGEGTSRFLEPSGYTGAAPFTGPEPGSNGLTFDPEGRLVSCEHGDRRITRLEADGTKRTLVDSYQGKRLNSPNDVVFRSNGDMYFTDPPFGLPGVFEDPEKELPFSGVYRLSRDFELTLLTAELPAPNGIAFSPDEKTLYVSDPIRKLWMAYDVEEDGSLGEGRALLEAGTIGAGQPGGPDGIKLDRAGNLFAAAPGGVHVIAPDGTLLGAIELGAATGNCAWGNDGSSLFIASSTALYRVRLNTRGAGF